MIVFLVRLLAFEFGGRVVKALGYFAGALIVVILLGSPVLGLLTNPLAPFWLSGKASIPVAAGPGSTAVPVIGNPITTPVPTLSPLEPGPIAEGVIALAMTWRGTRYLWGGCDRRGIDCSCFMLNVFAQFGVHLPRTTTQQIQAARAISSSEARAGDLVFYDNTCTECGPNPTHVGLVVSRGVMIDAGDPVQVEAIFNGHNARYGRVIG